MCSGNRSRSDAGLSHLARRRVTSTVMNHVIALTAEERHANLDLDQLRQLIVLVEYDVTDAPRVPHGIGRIRERSLHAGRANPRSSSSTESLTRSWSQARGVDLVVPRELFDQIWVEFPPELPKYVNIR